MVNCVLIIDFCFACCESDDVWDRY